VDDLTIWSLFGLGIGVFWFFTGFKRLRLRRRVLGLATSRIRSMAMGVVELQGLARIETTVNDPIYNKPCAYFRVVVKEERGSGRNRSWVTIYEADSANTPFLLEDGTGVARVCPAKVDVQFPPVLNESATLLRGLRDDAVSRFLSSLPGSGFNTRRVTAHILREGEPLFLVGYANAALGAPGMSAPVAARDAARELKNDPAAMKQLDTNLDGVVDADEWEAGVARKSRELSERASTEAGAAPADALISVGCCPDGLFVFAHTQDNLLSSLEWSAWAGILGGPAVALASAVYLLQQFHHLSPGVRHLAGLDLPNF
jgi:hypothetical protein